MSSYRLHVQEPWLTCITRGLKTIEGRRGPFSKFVGWIGHHVLLYNQEHKVEVTIKDVRHYDTLEEYLVTEDSQKVAPGYPLEKILGLYEDIIDEKGEHPYSSDNVHSSGGMNALEIELV